MSSTAEWEKQREAPPSNIFMPCNKLALLLGAQKIMFARQPQNEDIVLSWYFGLDQFKLSFNMEKLNYFRIFNCKPLSKEFQPRIVEDFWIGCGSSL